LHHNTFLIQLIDLKKIIVIAAFFLSLPNLYAQEKKPSPLESFSVSGNYRFFGQHRVFTDPYVLEVVDGNPIHLQDRAILLGDATQLPELTLNISGRPNSKTSFGTDLVVWNQNTGNFDYYKGLQLGINLYGGFSTKHANINVRAGGIHWHVMTPLTLRSFSGYNRFSLFDRNPWDPQFSDINKRYTEYYEKGAITQDQRWGSQAVQGMIVDITELPFGLSTNLIYGKTQNAGTAFNTQLLEVNDSTSRAYTRAFINTIPNFVYGGRLIKTVKSHTISINTLNHRSYLDLLATQPIDNHVVTSEFNFNWKKLRLNGEVGMGKYMDYKAGEMVSVKANFDKSLTKLPFEIHYYRLSPNVVNANAEFVNTTITEARPASAGSQPLIGANGVLQQTGSAMLALGQMANNRQGVNINTDIKLDNLTITLGNGIAKELENINNKVTYGHIINGLTISQFWRWTFPTNVGAYNRTSGLFRGVFETVMLTDLSDNGQVVNDKYFNNMEAQVKYKSNLFGRPWHIFYLGAYNSIQPKFSPVTVFTEEAYIRLYAHQLESYYNIHPKVVLAQYLGWERVIGNYSTQVDIKTQRPLNQQGIAIGGGIDYMLAKNTALYLRHRWFSFEDRSYQLEKFSGHETTLELKIQF
jgi:hypothetical protein